jgi:hypothetical protein
MRSERRMHQVRSFALYACIAGAAAAYALLLWLHLMEAPIPREFTLVAWTSPGLAFAGLAASCWFGPGLLVRLTGGNC